MSEWQPIETAPKDGTKVDLWVVDQDGNGWREPDAYWVINRQANPYARDTACAGEMRDGWFAPNHDYEGQDGWCDDPQGCISELDGRFYFEKATHWMPLPSPPSD